ncbi:MAG: alpha/beta hydrolase [Candidatus Bathyarchaeota archaeon]|nr:MAG: alpha/beta hydrolase [Candidatus Bathyarchaeota archaeon]
MHYVTQGEGKLLLLLHGFPDFWYVWRFQIPALAKHFRVVAPDLRGYNKTEKPEGIDNYRLNLLAGDILGLIHALGEKRAITVGHDWGGVVAWSLAAFNPEAVEKLVILNAPHPNMYISRTRTLLRQLQKSWYVFFFQTADIPEEVLSQNEYLFLKNMLRHSFAREETLTEKDLEIYAKAWSKPGALTAAINYYRANMNPSVLFSERTIAFPKVKSPTLVIWGERDVALSKDLIVDTQEFVDAPYSIKYLPKCGHWVQLEEPKIVNRYLLEFLGDS